VNGFGRVERLGGLLKVDGWSSGYESVEGRGRLLRHLKCKTGNEGSRATYLKILAMFVRFTGLNLDQLVSLRKKEVEERVQAFCDLARALRTANRKMEELKTFFKCNGFRNGDKCNLVLEKRYVGAGQRSKPEYIPTDEEIYRMANEDGLNLKWRAFILTLYTTGMRNSTVRVLRYGDIREELESGITPLLVRIYPEMKGIVPEACKITFHTLFFMPKETVEAIEAYLDEREERLGPLGDDQILFCTDNRQIPIEKRPYTPLDMTAPQKFVRKAAKNVGIREWRYITPHSLRKAFERAVRNSGLNTKDQEFFMGHILPGTQDVYYDKTKIEEFRQKCAKILFFPQRGFLTEEMRKRQLLDTARLLGFNEEKIKRLEEILARTKNVDEAIEKFRRLQEDPPEANDIKIVKGDEALVEHLKQGWTLIKELNHDKYLLKKV